MKLLFFLILLCSCSVPEPRVVYIEKPAEQKKENKDTSFAIWHMSVAGKDTAMFNIHIRYVSYDERVGGGYYLRGGILSKKIDSVVSWGNSTNIKTFTSIAIDKSKHYGFQIVLIAYNYFGGEYWEYGRGLKSPKMFVPRYKNSLLENILIIPQHGQRKLRFYDEGGLIVTSVQPADTLVSEVIRFF